MNVMPLIVQDLGYGSVPHLINLCVMSPRGLISNQKNPNYVVISFSQLVNMYSWSHAYQFTHTPYLGVQVQTHPNIDKKLFLSHSQIGLKNPAKPFPTNNDVGVLKWRLQTTGENETAAALAKMGCKGGRCHRF